MPPPGGAHDSAPSASRSQEQVSEFYALVAAAPRGGASGSRSPQEEALVRKLHVLIDDFLAVVAGAISGQGMPQAGSGTVPPLSGVSAVGAKGTVAERTRVEAALDARRFEYAAVLLCAAERPDLLRKSHWGGLFPKLVALLTVANGRLVPPGGTGRPNPGGTSGAMWLAQRSDAVPQLAATVLLRAYADIVVDSGSQGVLPENTTWPVELVPALLENCFATSGGTPPISVPRYSGCLAAAAFQGIDSIFQVSPSEERPEANSVAPQQGQQGDGAGAGRGKRGKRQPDIVVEFVLNTLTFAFQSLEAAVRHARFLLGRQLLSSGGSAEQEISGVIDRLRLRYPVAGPARASIMEWAEKYFSENLRRLITQRDESRGTKGSAVATRDAWAVFRTACILAPLPGVRREVCSLPPETVIDWMRRAPDLSRIVRLMFLAVAHNISVDEVGILSSVLKLLRVTYFAAPPVQRSSQRAQEGPKFDGRSTAQFLCRDVVKTMCIQSPRTYGEVCLKHLMFNEMLPSCKTKVSASSDAILLSRTLSDRVQDALEKSTGLLDLDRELLLRSTTVCAAMNVARPAVLAPVGERAMPQIEHDLFGVLMEARSSGFELERVTGDTLAEMCSHGTLQAKIGKMRVLVRRLFAVLAAPQSSSRIFDWALCVVSLFKRNAALCSKMSEPADQLNVALAVVDLLCCIQFNLIPSNLYSVDLVLTAFAPQLFSSRSGRDTSNAWDVSIRNIQRLCVQWWSSEFCAISGRFFGASDNERHHALCLFAAEKLLLLGAPSIYGLGGITAGPVRVIAGRFPELAHFRKQAARRVRCDDLFHVNKGLRDGEVVADQSSLTRGLGIEENWCQVPMCSVPVLDLGDIHAMAELLKGWGVRRLDRAPPASFCHPWIITLGMQTFIWRSLGQKLLDFPDVDKPASHVVRHANVAISEICSKRKLGILVEESTLVLVCRTVTSGNFSPNQGLHIIDGLIRRAARRESGSRDTLEDFPCNSTDIIGTLEGIVSLARPPSLQKLIDEDGIRKCSDEAFPADPEGRSTLQNGLMFVSYQFHCAFRCVMLCLCFHTQALTKVLGADDHRTNSKFKLFYWIRHVLEVMLRVAGGRENSNKNAIGSVASMFFDLASRLMSESSAAHDSEKIQGILNQAVTRAIFDQRTPEEYAGGVLWCSPEERSFQPRFSDLGIFESIWEDLSEFSALEMIGLRASDSLVSLSEALDKRYNARITEFVLSMIGTASPSISRLPIEMICQILLSTAQADGPPAWGDQCPDSMRQQVNVLHRNLLSSDAGTFDSNFKMLHFFVSKLTGDTAFAALSSLELLLTTIGVTSTSGAVSRALSDKSWVGGMLSIPAWSAGSTEGRSKVVAALLQALSVAGSQTHSILQRLSPQVLSDIIVLLYKSSEEKLIVDDNALLALSRILCMICGQGIDHRGAYLVREGLQLSAELVEETTLFDVVLRCLTKARTDLLNVEHENDRHILARGVLLLFSFAPSAERLPKQKEVFSQLLFKPIVEKTFVEGLNGMLDETRLSEALLMSQNSLVANRFFQIASPAQLFAGTLGLATGQNFQWHLVSADSAKLLLERLDQHCSMLVSRPDSTGAAKGRLRELVDCLRSVHSLSAGATFLEELGTIVVTDDEVMKDDSGVTPVPFRSRAGISSLKISPQMPIDSFTFSFEPLKSTLNAPSAGELRARVQELVSLGDLLHDGWDFSDLIESLLSFPDAERFQDDKELASGLLDLVEFLPLEKVSPDLRMLRFLARWVVREEAGVTRKRLVERYVRRGCDLYSPEPSLEAIREELSLCASNLQFKPMCDFVWRSTLALVPKTAPKFDLFLFSETAKIQSPIDQTVLRLLEKFLLGNTLMRSTLPLPVRLSSVIGIVDQVLVSLTTRSFEGGSSLSSRILLLNSWTRAIVNVAQGEVASASDELANRTTTELGNKDAVSRQCAACGTLINAVHLLSEMLRANMNLRISDFAGFNHSAQFDIGPLSEAVGMAINFLLKNAQAISDDIDQPGTSQLTVFREMLELLGKFAASLGVEVLSAPNFNHDITARTVLQSAVCELTHVNGLYEFLSAGGNVAITKAGKAFVRSLSWWLGEQLDGDVPEPSTGKVDNQFDELLGAFRGALVCGDSRTAGEAACGLRDFVERQFDEDGTLGVLALGSELSASLVSATSHLSDQFAADSNWMVCRSVLISSLAVLVSCGAGAEEHAIADHASSVNLSVWLANEYCRALDDFCAFDAEESAHWISLLVSAPTFPRIFALGVGTRAQVLDAVSRVSRTQHEEFGQCAHCFANQAISEVVRAALL